MPEPRWISLLPDDLRAAGYGTILDAAERTPVGTVDPVAKAITGAVQRVRRAVAAGNTPDRDTTKIPRSLEMVTIRMAICALQELIGLPLTEDQRKSRDLDQTDLADLAKRKTLVEKADDPDPTLAPDNRGAWNSENKLLGRMHPTPTPARQFPPMDRAYANPDAPADA